jgi:hypothetical protein
LGTCKRSYAQPEKIESRSSGSLKGGSLENATTPLTTPDPYETNPGHVELVSSANNDFGFGGGGLPQAIETSFVSVAKLEFDVEAGRVYYVKLHPESHPFYFQPQLFLRTDSEGESEIKVCKLDTE